MDAADISVRPARVDELPAIGALTIAAYRADGYLPESGDPTGYAATLSDADFTTFLELYPADPRMGSPFGTGTANAITPLFKRLSAMQGDLLFQAPRRFLLDQRAGKQKVFSFGEYHHFLSRRICSLIGVADRQ